MSWLDDLSRALVAARIPAGRRRRILDELADHLDADPSAVERLGDPAEIARRFADEVGTSLARCAAFATFVSLVPLGLLFGVLFVLYSGTSVNGPVLLGTQVAFVGGSLAVLRAWRLRRELTFPSAQSTILLRRALLGIAGGALTAGGVVAAAAQGHGSEGFVALAYTTGAIGAATLAASTTLVVGAARLRPLAAGPASGDLGSDLGIADTPWQLALKIAGLVALCIAIAGVFQDDPFDGLARALADGVACLAGFAVLGRWLGLR